MKTYTIAKLKQLASEQQYKLAALENSQGDRIVKFNNPKTKIAAQFELIQKRLSSELNLDGVYFILLAHNINAASTPDRFPILKGKVKPEEISEAEKKSIPLTPVIMEKQPNVLTWESAVQMNKTISDQAATIKQLEWENAQLQLQVEQLEDAADDETPLNDEPEQGGGLKWLADLVPQLLPMADRYFDLEEKKLGVLMKQQGAKSQPKQFTKVNTQKPPKSNGILAGSPEHLELIESLYFSDAPNSEAEFNKQMDFLQAHLPALHDQVLETLENAGEEEEEEEND